MNTGINIHDLTFTKPENTASAYTPVFASLSGKSNKRRIWRICSASSLTASHVQIKTLRKTYNNAPMNQGDGNCSISALANDVDMVIEIDMLMSLRVRLLLLLSLNVKRWLQLSACELNDVSSSSTATHITNFL